MRVFVVEDSDAICERIVRMVNEVKSSTVIGTSNSVVGAIRAIKSCLPDAVVLDIQLLDGSGLAVLKHIKKVMPAIKVIVLTNFISDPYRELAQRHGADAFLDKSNDFMQIPKLLEDWQQVADAIAH
jgi:DNA-binding NarL/FixJ family response regulator